MAILEPLFADSQASPEDEVRKRQRMAQMLLAGGEGPITHPLQMIGSMAQTAVGNHQKAKADAEARKLGMTPQANAASENPMFDLGRALGQQFGGGGFPPAPKGLF